LTGRCHTLAVAILHAALVGALLVSGQGCAPPRARYPQALQSDRTDQRIWAIRRAAENQDRSVVGILVERLDDEDEAVRFYAILALERITGTRLGYRYGAPERERRQAILAWGRYLRQGDLASRPCDRGTGDGH
jgi:HEAT repeat protein